MSCGGSPSRGSGSMLYSFSRSSLSTKTHASSARRMSCHLFSGWTGVFDTHEVLTTRLSSLPSLELLLTSHAFWLGAMLAVDGVQRGGNCRLSSRREFCILMYARPVRMRKSQADTASCSSCAVLNAREVDTCIRWMMNSVTREEIIELPFAGTYCVLPSVFCVLPRLVLVLRLRCRSTALRSTQHFCAQADVYCRDVAFTGRVELWSRV